MILIPEETYVFAVDGRGRIVWSASATGAEYDPKHYFQRSILELVVDDDRGMVRDKFNACAVGGLVSDYRTRALIPTKAENERGSCFNEVPIFVRLLPVDIPLTVIAAFGVIAKIPERACRLSLTDIQLLKLLADGMAVAEAAKKLNRAESTIHAHLAKLKNKLGKETLAGIVAQALRTGLIQ